MAKDRIWINPAHDCRELRDLVSQANPGAQIMGKAPAAPARFPTELTAVGEQFLIPGCERKANPSTKHQQSDLWEAAGRRETKDGR